MRLRFLQLPDMHLGCRNFYLAEKARERSEDFRLAFRDAMEFALDAKNAIDGVLITGNLFEFHRPEEELWSFVKGFLSRLLAKNIRIAVIPGNHDSYAYKNSVWRTERLPGVDLFLNPTSAAPKVHEIRDTRVFLYGLAYVPGQTPSPLPVFEKSKDHGVHIGLLHGRTGPADPERPLEARLDPRAQAAAGLDFIAVGGEAAYREETIASTTFVWPGVAEGRGFEAGEEGDKGPVVLEFDERGVHIERLVRNRRSVETITIDLHAERITDAQGLKEALASRAARDRIACVRVVGTAEFVADLEEIRAAVADSFFHLEIHDESRLVDSALLRKIESENTIRGYFIRKLGARIAEIRERIVKKGQTPELMRLLDIHENAMKIGVEQFVEDEAPPDSIYSLIPDSDETVAGAEAKQKIGVGDLEEKVRAMLEYRRKLNSGHANGKESAGLNGARGENPRSESRAMEMEEEA